MQPEKQEMIGHRYRLLNKLGEGGMGAVYRAFDRLTGQQVAVKRVHTRTARRPPGTRAVFAETMALPSGDLGASPTEAQIEWRAGPTDEELVAFRLALAGEFHALASLRHPNIISVLDYGFDAERQPYLTMELLTDAVPLLSTAAAQSLELRLNWLGQILIALMYLHRRGILHRDLKPSNLLLIPSSEGLRVKVLDFGLALEDRGINAQSAIAGTLGYLAPELLLGQAPSQASDLYSLGVIAYELISGRHPFPFPENDTLIRVVLSDDPARAPLGTDEQLAAWVLRLMDRRPEHRFGDATEALVALFTARGQTLPAESHEVRESYLQAARFVGRQQEFATLSNALSAAMQGHGSTWLVAGESGVGKSRLLDELRTLALVRGVRVLRGQVESSAENARPPFLDMLRALALDIPIDDDDASALKVLVPDLPNLLERPLPDPLPLGPQATQQRLLRITVELFTSSNTPVLFLLEDIHWAPFETIAILKAVTAVLASRPMLVVASFRDDERPGLPQEVPGASLLKMRRFGPQAIGELCVSMLGSTAQDPELLNLLTRETEGNAFFMVEVVRALAEHAGGLASVGKSALPQSVLTRGIQSVLQQRLLRIPGSAQAILKLAAVAGRKIDRLVLGEIEPQMERWLQLCTDAAILEITDAQWQFAHDKLRERLLASLPAEETKSLHRRLGEAMERVYGHDGPHVGVLGRHFDEAGDWTKAGEYLSKAGSLALRRGWLRQATELLERGLVLQERTGATALSRSVTLRRLSRALIGSGRLDEGLERARQALALLGHPIPPQGPLRWLTMLHELGIELHYRLATPKRERNPERFATAQEILTLIRGTNDAFFIAKGRQDEALLVMLWGLHAAERIEDVEQQANFLSWLGYAAYVAPLHSLGKFYLRRAEQLMGSNPTTRSTSHWDAMSSYVYAAEGRWKEGEAALGRWIDQEGQAGISAPQALALSSRVAVRMSLGNLDGAEVDATACSRLGERLANPIYLGSASGWKGLIRWRKGDFPEAYRFARKANAVVEPSTSTVHKLVINGLVALSAQACGELGEARDHVDTALRRMRRCTPSAPSYYSGYASVLWVSIRLLEGSAADSAPLDAERRVRDAVHQMLRFAIVFPIGWPTVFYGLGRYLWFQRKARLALGALQASVRAAIRYPMRYEEGLAEHWLGRIGSAAFGAGVLSRDAAKAHLEKAVTIFREQDAQHELAETQQLLSKL